MRKLDLSQQTISDEVTERCPGCFVLDEMPHESTCPDLKDGEESVQIWYAPEVVEIANVTVTSSQYGRLNPDGTWEIWEALPDAIR